MVSLQNKLMTTYTHPLSIRVLILTNKKEPAETAGSYFTTHLKASFRKSLIPFSVRCSTICTMAPEAI